MEEIDNRFELIRIAVALADHDVIDLQIRRLRNFSTDVRLHAILDELERKNFRQALFLMKEYAQAPEDHFFDDGTDTATPEEEKAPEPSESTEGLFDLETQTNDASQEHILGLDEMLKMTRESAATPRAYASAEPKKQEASTAEIKPYDEDDPLFALERNGNEAEATEPAPVRESVPETDPLASEERAREPQEAVETVSELSDAAKTVSEDLFAFSDDEDEAITEDLFGDSDAADLEEPVPPEPTEEETFAYEMGADEEPAVPESRESTPSATEADPETEDEARQEANEPIPAIPEHMKGERYAAFAYMGQKYRNMLHQYPQIETAEEGITEEVQRFIDYVSQHEYSEAQVEAAIARYQELKQQGKRAAAAQMLIAAATTESKFAQFMLARELFKGEVLRQNYPEAFTQINHLAEEDFPEAICDLGQLYEYGIGIDKNKRHALLLYEEAAEMGIERARKHYERLRSANPLKALSSLFRRGSTG